METMDAGITYIWRCNPKGWLIKAESYFDLNGISTVNRLRAAVACVEEDALDWYYYKESHKTFRGGRNSGIVSRMFSFILGWRYDEATPSASVNHVDGRVSPQLWIVNNSLPEPFKTVLGNIFINGLQNGVEVELRL